MKQFRFKEWWARVEPALSGAELCSGSPAWNEFVAMCNELGQSEAARALGLSPSVVSRIVRGNPLTPKVCQAWAKYTQDDARCRTPRGGR